jgi:hypothetical protein
VSHRPLVLVSGLTVGDYLLWSWSLSGNHEVLALVSGLTLPPLAVACVWLLVLSTARLIAHLARRAPARRPAATAPEEPLASVGSPDPPSRKLAA